MSVDDSNGSWSRPPVPAGPGSSASGSGASVPGAPASATPVPGGSGPGAPVVGGPVVGTLLVGPAGPDGDPSLARLLAILWRRRAIVIALTALGFLAGVAYDVIVKPLYRATANVRPGVTAFTERGDPVRDWKLKDITFWFNQRLYADDLRHAFGWEPDRPAPPILAEFIARGSQNIQGGDVITLTALDTDPIRCEKILDTAIRSFDAYVEADTVGSGLALTRAGLTIRIANARNEENKLGAKSARLALQITEAEKELASLDATRARYDLELKKVAQENETRRSLLAMAQTQAREAAANRRALESGARRLAMRDTAEAFPDPPAAAGSAAGAGTAAAGPAALQPGWGPGFSAASARSVDAAAASEMATSALALRRFEQRNLTLADSLRLELALAENAVTDIKLKRDVDLERTRAGILAKLGDLKLQQGDDIDAARVSLEQEVRGRRAQLAVLSPLERVGKIAVTTHPVRPRKLRALSILTALGFLGSLAAAVGWDYLTANRDVVLGRR